MEPNLAIDKPARFEGMESTRDLTTGTSNSGEGGAESVDCNADRLCELSESFFLWYKCEASEAD